MNVGDLVCDAFRPTLPTAIRKFHATPALERGVAGHVVSYDMECFAGASCENPGHEGRLMRRLWVSDEDLAKEGVKLRDGKLEPLEFDELLLRSPRVRVCNELAEKAHAGQTRKHGPPYILHPRAVARRLWNALKNADVELICAALLHDTLEDCDVTSEQIEQLAGARVRHLVEAVTKPEGVTKAEYLQTIEGKSADAKALKIADRTENLLDAKLHPDPKFVAKYVLETEQYLLPLAKFVPAELRSELEGALAALRTMAR